MGDEGLVLGVDVGGTFTDLLLLDPDSGHISVAKIPTTPDQSVGFMAGIDALGLDLARTRTIVHGTTAATNAVLERKGARCGLITTQGFGDILELARRTRPHLFGLTGEFEALISRELRVEVKERIDADGDVLVPLDENDVRGAVRVLKERGAEAVAIHFLHSYANPVHERRCLELVRALWHNAYVSAGSELLPEIREFERGTVVALNAYVQPIVAGYVERLARRLADARFVNTLLIMQGNGGMMDATVAHGHAVHTVLSGPASGAIAAARIGAAADLPNLITCDMGGTSFDVSVIVAGEPAITRERNIDYAIPLRIPMIDIHTIGAGGGSIARITNGGMLQVGPQSAGAEPGPICFGRGATEPTVTDANLVLGRINPACITGVPEQADVARVRDVIGAKIGAPLGLDPIAASAGILAVANAAMADAIRFMSIEKGFDPRDFAIFAFGGAGPLHASALARELGVPKVLVPPYPGITSALGCVLADVRHDYGVTINRPLLDVDGTYADRVLREQGELGRALIAREAIDVTGIELLHEADFQYQGQTHVMRMPVTSPGFDPARVRVEFERVYRARFDVDLSEMVPMLSALRTAVIGRRAHRATLRAVRSGANSRSGAALRDHVSGFGVTERVGSNRSETSASTRRVWFGEWRDARIHARDALRPDDVVEGPAIVEQLDATTVIEPGDSARVDAQRNLIISIAPAAAGVRSRQ